MRDRFCGSAIGMVIAAVLAGCSTGDWEAVSYEIGDTTVVRTVSGSVWRDTATLVEEVRAPRDPENAPAGVAAIAVGPDDAFLVVDGPERLVHVYDAEGVYSQSIGPRMLVDPNGIALLPDDRFVVRDPPTQRLRVFTMRGNHLGDWPLPQPRGFRTGAPLFTDPEGRVYARIFLQPEEASGGGRQAYIRYSAEGAIEDTIPDPDMEFRPWTLEVESTNGEKTTFVVPFSPRAVGTRSTDGGVIVGISGEYALDVIRPDGSVLRIEREAEAVPTQEDERWAHYSRVDLRARQIDYGWTWRGPAIPETKPYFKSVFTDLDGRIWVQLHQPAERVASGEPESDEEAGEVAIMLQRAQESWVEPVVFDVFEPDGRYLGQVRTPKGFRAAPRPVIRGDRVWAVVREAGQPPSVIRFRLEH